MTMTLLARVTFRSLRRDIGLMTLSILVLGSGLGVNLAFLNAAYAILFRNLDFPEQQQLYTVASRSTDGTWSNPSPVSGSDAAAIRHNVAAAKEVGLIATGPHLTLLSQSDEIDLASAEADSGYFRSLRIQPFAGEFFGDDDDLGTAGETRAVLTYAAWTRYFHRDPSIVGRSLSYANGASLLKLRIVGIIPSGISLPFASDAELVTALPSRSAAIATDQGDALHRCILRVYEGRSASEISGEIRNAFEKLHSQDAAQYSAPSLRAALEPVDKRNVLLLVGAGILFLVLTSANLACLFVARTVRRARNTAVQLALGTRRGSLLFSHLFEAWFICLLGTMFALILNVCTRSVILWIFPELHSLGPDLLRIGPALLLASALFAFVVGGAVALPAAWIGSRSDIRHLLSSLDRGTTNSATRWPSVFLIAQTGIVVLLLAVGGLLAHSFSDSLDADPGFNPAGVITFRTSMPAAPSAEVSMLTTTIQQLRSVPTVRDVTYSSEPPIGKSFATTMNTGAPFSQRDPVISFRMVGPHYFETLGARVSQGRTFTDDEILHQNAIIVLNESASRLLFHGNDPEGRAVHLGFLNLRASVVGVVEDIHHLALDKPAGPVAYIPYHSVFPGGVSIIVRGTAKPRVLYSDLQTRMRGWPVPIYPRSYTSLVEETRETVHDRLVASMLVDCFAVLGLLITSLGLYGFLSNEVYRRTREIGIRMAFGASRSSVVWVATRRGVFILGIGFVVGTIASFAVARLIHSMLYGVNVFDPLSQLPALFLLLVGGLLACLVPAVRGVRIAPIQALKEQ